MSVTANEAGKLFETLSASARACVREAKLGCWLRVLWEWIIRVRIDHRQLLRQTPCVRVSGVNTDILTDSISTS